MANYFTDRVVQYPGRVTMVPVQGEANTYDMSRAEGDVTNPGTPFNAETFNDIADDIIQDADDNIITDAELQTIATALGVTPAKLYNILSNMAFVEDITNDISVTASTGSFVSAIARKCGKVVQIGLYVNNSAEVAAGANIFVGTLNPASLRPLVTTTGSNYIGQRAIAGQISTSGAITIRNSSSSALTIGGNFYIGFTYLIP